MTSDVVDWFAKQSGYSPHAYEQLALVLQNHGATADATWVRYMGREKEREGDRQVFKDGWWHAWRYEPWTAWRYTWSTILDRVAGYGYYPEQAIVPALLMVALGAAALRISNQGPANGMPIGLSYSFDMLLPLIRLREKHYQVELFGPVRYYFYFHKLVGWVLGLILVGGISGVTK
jgi:hypothetical protein